MRRSAAALQRALCLAACVALFATAGCHRALEVTPRTLLDDGRADPMHAFSRYRGGVLSVEGLLVYRGMRPLDSRAGAWDGRTSKRGMESTHVPYMVLRDLAVPQSGVVVCYFTIDELDAVAAVPLNTHVKIRGKFQEYFSAQGEHAVALYECELAGLR